MRIRFHGSFSPSHSNLYILVVVDYVSKWVDGIATPTNDTKVIIKFLKKNIFIRFDPPRSLLRDNWTHFSTSPRVTFEDIWGVPYGCCTLSSKKKWASGAFKLRDKEYLREHGG